MDIKKTYGFDQKLAENGTWHELPDGGRVCVAKLGNPAHKAELARLQKPVLSILRSTKIDNTDLIDSITIEAMAKTILMGWTNISLDGVEIEYSVGNAIKLLTEFPDFREMVSELAIDSSHFQVEEIAGK